MFSCLNEKTWGQKIPWTPLHLEGLKIRIKVTVVESGIILRDLRCLYASTRDKVIN